MSDDIVSVAPDPAHDKDILLYDYSKHLLSLALFGLGGIASLAQSPLGQRIPALVIAMLMGALAVAGFLALSCTATILRARKDDLYSRGAMMFLGIGVGGFMVVWIKELTR